MANSKSNLSPAQKQALKQLEKEFRERQRALEKEFRQRAAELKKLGLYNPKIEPGQPLPATKARRARVNKILAENKTFLDDARYEAVRIIGDEKKKKTVRRQAKQSGLRATLDYIFVEKKSPKTKTRVRKVQGQNRYVLVQQGVDKDTGKPITANVLPLGDKSGVSKQLRKIERIARKEAQKLGPGSEIRVISYGKYVWKRAYQNLDLLLGDLEKYQGNRWSRDDLKKTPGEFSEFIENIEFKVMPDMPWAEARERLGISDRKRPVLPKGYRFK